MPPSRAPHVTNAPLAVLCITFMVLGAVLSYLGYIWGYAAVNPNELLGALLFWPATLCLVYAFPLREAFDAFVKHVRTALGAAIFAAYLAVHLALYGFLLEGILTTVYGVQALAVSPGFLFTTNTLRPASIVSAGLDLAYNPSIAFAFPPVFSAALSLYSIAIALLISTLVVASVGEARKVFRARSDLKGAGTYVALPVLGVVFGASCCLSVAGIVGIAVPAASLLTSVAWIYYLTYLLFPVAAILILWANFLSIRRMQKAMAPP